MKAAWEQEAPLAWARFLATSPSKSKRFSRFNHDCRSQQSWLNLENRFDFDGDVARKRAHANGASCSHAAFITEDFDEQFAATVDDLRMIAKVCRAIHHAENLDQARHSVEGTEVAAQRG